MNSGTRPDLVGVVICDVTPRCVGQEADSMVRRHHDDCLVENPKTLELGKQVSNHAIHTLYLEQMALIGLVCQDRLDPDFRLMTVQFSPAVVLAP